MIPEIILSLFLEGALASRPSAFMGKPHIEQWVEIREWLTENNPDYEFMISFIHKDMKNKRWEQIPLSWDGFGIYGRLKNRSA